VLKRRFNTGDLIYAPSHSMLYKETKSPSDWLKLKEPTNLLITAIDGDLYQVFYDNDYWFINKNEVYPT
tara:strand:- start:122 stop:328 length:207 start_codon:yes stop_codon:yes gene_type:complete